MPTLKYDPDNSLAGGLFGVTPREAIRLGVQLCAAVERAVGADGCHGGVWPGNITWMDGQVAVGQENRKSIADMEPEELEFVAPEQFWSGGSSPQSDVYAIGMIVYTALNRGVMPYFQKAVDNGPDERAHALQDRMKGEKLAYPATASRALGDVVLKAMAFQPEQRYATPGRLRAALEALPEGSELAAAVPVVPLTEQEKRRAPSYKVDKSFEETPPRRKRSRGTGKSRLAALHLDDDGPSKTEQVMRTLVSGHSLDTAETETRVPSSPASAEETKAPEPPEETKAVSPPETAATEETPAPAEETKTEEVPAPAEETKREDTSAPAEEIKSEDTSAPAEEAKTEEAPAPAEEAKSEDTPAPAEEAKTEATHAPAEETETAEAPAPAGGTGTGEVPAPAHQAEPGEASVPAEQPPKEAVAGGKKAGKQKSSAKAERKAKKAREQAERKAKKKAPGAAASQKPAASRESVRPQKYFRGEVDEDMDVEEFRFGDSDRGSDAARIIFPLLLISVLAAAVLLLWKNWGSDLTGNADGPSVTNSDAVRSPVPETDAPWLPPETEQPVPIAQQETEPPEESAPPRHYSLMRADVTWEEARVLAGENGGHLGVIRNGIQLEEVIELAEQLGVQFVWLGASRDAADGNWYYVTGEAMDFADWDAGEPSGAARGGENEDCLLLWYRPAMGSWRYCDQVNDPLSLLPGSYAGRMAYLIEYDLALPAPDAAADTAPETGDSAPETGPEAEP